MENTKKTYRIAYVFQGGGALGAYQVGVYKALSQNHYQPDWVIGTSIGAINASIIAGNLPSERIQKLEKFWNMISRSVIPGFSPHDDCSRQWYNWVSAQTTLCIGQPALFTPRITNPFFERNGSPDTISFYVTDPLRRTLESLIDFDLLNSGKVRVTLGAVEVEQGKGVFFDTKTHRIGPEHILASCALPPGFPAVKIEDEYYWDGGVLSNTPVQALIHDNTHENTICFMANLFDSFGLVPQSLDDVYKRYKDILYSSRDRMQLQAFTENVHLRTELQYLYEKLPEEVKKDPKIKYIHDYNCSSISMHFVRFLYTAPPTELSSKDFEFSTLSMHERMQVGYQDGLTAVETSPWKSAVVSDVGVAVHEICSHPTVTAVSPFKFAN